MTRKNNIWDVIAYIGVILGIVGIVLVILKILGLI